MIQKKNKQANNKNMSGDKLNKKKTSEINLTKLNR